MCKEYHKRTVYCCGHERMRKQLVKCFLPHKQKTAVSETVRYRTRTACGDCAISEPQVEARRRHMNGESGYDERQEGGQRGE